MQSKQREWIKSIDKDIQEVISILEETDEKKMRINPSNEEWSIIQIASHISEAIPFWLKQIELVLKVPNTKWGRSFFNDSRLKAISDNKILNTNKEEVIIDLEKVPLLAKQTISSLEYENLSITASSYYSVFEGKSVLFILEKEILEHIKGHIEQIKRVCEVI